ncbi:MAG: T9SS type A sorting domain-containing protein [Ignavibacteriales bacterium]|nr:T9SS type A sorting domain-containing protein [Ignavibacteriales bacterium]
MKNSARILLAIAFVFASSHLLLAQWTQTDGLYGGGIRSLFVSDSIVFAGKDNGVYISTDHGLSWTSSKMSPGGVSAFVTTHSDTGGTKFFAADLNSYVYRSTDKGASWSALNNGLTNQYVISLVASGANLFAGTRSGVFLSTNDGGTWNSVSSGLSINTAVMSLAVSNTKLFAGTAGDGVFLSTDGGNQWVQRNTGLTCMDVNVLGVSDTSFFAGTTGGVFRLTGNDTTWTQMGQAINVYAFCHDLSKPNGMNYFAGSKADSLFLSTDNGVSWPDIVENDQSHGDDILCLAISGSNLLAGARLSGVYRSTDNGSSWCESDSGLTLQIMCLATLGSDVYAGTGGGRIYASSNNGAIWERIGSLPHGGIFGFAVSPPANDTGSTNIFAATNGGVFLSSDIGKTWADVTTNLPTFEVRGIAIQERNIFAGTSGGGVFYTNNNGVSWIRSSSGLTSDTVWALGASDSVIFAGILDGLFRSTDSGASWTKTSFLSNEPLRFSSAWSITVIDHDVFVSTEEGIWVSTDVGITWTLMPGELGKSINHFAETKNNVLAKSFLNAGEITSLAAKRDFLFAGTSRGVWKIPISNITSVRMPDRDVSTAFRLEQNYPNPFNPTTTIKYGLPLRSQVRIQIFNILGQVVKELVNTEQQAGYQSIVWNANVSSGLYFYRLEATSKDDPSKLFVETKKMLLLR